MKNTFTQAILILKPEQKKKFQEHIPDKVYRIERNISIVVALTQICMIFIFLFNHWVVPGNVRGVAYFSLYIFLLTVTLIALCLYYYVYKYKKLNAFLWLRRVYCFLLCLWVIGIAFLEQMHGKGITVYCYFVPTTAAFLLLTPIESAVIFGSTWIGLLSMFVMASADGTIAFGDLVNSSFVTVLSFFISYRYYRSMATEFMDREIIDHQYEEIQEANCLLRQTAYIDQLTGINNRHFLVEKVYPQFARYKKKQYYGMFLMLDIDSFKQYNDLYGHIQGDDCLRKISEVLGDICEEEGAFAIRYGGEEFLMMKMDGTAIDGMKFAQRIQCEIAKLNIGRTDVKQKQVTVSIGLWDGPLEEMEHIEMAIKRVDDALYFAKSNGRDQISTAK